MSDKGMGSSVLRKEDFRFITGKGQYTDDISQPNQLYAYFLRSPVAHAKLISVNTEKADNSPGVIAVYTGKDIERRVLTNAVQAHVDKRVIVHEGRTIVFQR